MLKITESMNLPKKNEIPTLQVGYEEICFYPDHMLSILGKFLEIEPDREMLSLQNSGSHIALGNRMRSQKEKRRRILYDNRWFYRREWEILAIIFPHIMNYNNESVYQHVSSDLWRQ